MRRFPAVLILFVLLSIPLITLTGCSKLPFLTDDGPRTYRFREEEPAWLMGVIAGQLTLSDAPLANSAPIVGLISEEGHPLWETHIRPAFEAGCYRIDPGIRCEVRLLGPELTAETAVEELTALGADTVFTLAGSRDAEVVEACSRFRCYALAGDGAGLAGETLAARCLYRRGFSDDRLYRRLASLEMPPAEPLTAGFLEGFIRFGKGDRGWRIHVPRDIRKETLRLVRKLDGGLIRVVKPEFME